MVGILASQRAEIRMSGRLDVWKSGRLDDRDNPDDPGDLVQPSCTVAITSDALLRISGKCFLDNFTLEERYSWVYEK